jgi:glycosyltransferase involved in cell wall biosynthesis
MFGPAAHFAEQTHRGAAVAQAALRLRNSGYTPDLIIGHAGWGETLFLGEVWPNARRIAYAEFFYRPHGLDVEFDSELQPRSFRQAIWVRARQAAQLLALNDATDVWSPTRWQASTYPPGIRDRITVIHDGIDTELLRPNLAAALTLPGTVARFRHGDEILTFVSRNLEPYRGYHIFMRALPRILSERPDVQVVIVGGDEISYGEAPPRGTTWKQVFLSEVGECLDPARVHFTGKIPYRQFVALMQATRVHAYLTYPFVLSWSMLEAMSCGALVVGSRTPPVEEVITDGINGRLVDFFDIDGWTTGLIDALANSARDAPLRAAARRTVVDKYDLRSVCLPRQLDFLRA